MDNNKEISPIELFILIYENKVFFILTVLFFLFLASIHVYNSNSKLDYVGKIVLKEKSMDSEHLALWTSYVVKIREAVEDTEKKFGSDRVEPRYFKTSNIPTTNMFYQNLINLNYFNEILTKFKKDNKISEGQYFKIETSIHANDIGNRDIDLMISSNKKLNLKDFIKLVLFNANYKTNQILLSNLEEDYKTYKQYVIDITEDVLRQRNIEIQNIKERLNLLKLYTSMARDLNIENQLPGFKVKVFNNFMNEYIRGYKSLELEIDLLNQFINDPDKFEEIYGFTIFQTPNLSKKIDINQLYTQENIDFLNQIEHVFYRLDQIKITKPNDKNIIVYLILAFIIGSILAFFVILFRYSIKVSKGT
tara:strand:- start:54 stop:1142 length:1089 start_codon:yes stop_codon:yes gene_type:complete